VNAQQSHRHRFAGHSFQHKSPIQTSKTISGLKKKEEKKKASVTIAPPTNYTSTPEAYIPI